MKSMERALERLFQLSQKFLFTKNQKYKRYFIQKTDLSERLSIFTGQRGVGKTTLLVQYLLAYAKQDNLSQKILYVPSDHIALGGMSLYEIAEAFEVHGGEFIAFDEIHKIINWSASLKSIYDSFPKLKIVASGSSALEIHKGSHDLSRRAILYRIAGLSFREYLELTLGQRLFTIELEGLFGDHQKYCRRIMAELDKQNAGKILSHFRKYLKYGFYPYYFELKNEAKYEITLEQNIHTTIEADLASIHPNLSGMGVTKIRKLLTFIAQHVPYTPNWLHLKEVLDIGDERTLKGYFALLEEAELVLSLHKSSTKLDAYAHPEKIYLHNPNICFAIAKGQENVGTIRETFMLNALYRRHLVTLPTNGDFLVDKTFVLEVGGANKSGKQLRGLQKAFVVQDNLEMGFGNKIPIWLFGFLY